MTINSLSFCLTGIVFASPSFVKDIFTEYRISGQFLFFFCYFTFVVWLFSSTHYYGLEVNCFYKIVPRIVICFVLFCFCLWHIIKCFFILAFYDSSIILICLDMSFFVFILLGIYWAPWIWKVIFFFLLLQEEEISSKKKFSAPSFSPS